MPDAIVSTADGRIKVAPFGSDVVVPLTVRAEVAAVSAENSAATAVAASGPTYASTVAGLAATTNGQAFAVNTGDGIVSIYVNNAGSAVLQRSLGTTTYNDGRFTQKADLASSAVGKGAGLIGVSPTTAYPTNTVGSSLNRFFNFTNPTFELIDLGASLPANGVYMGAAGNSLSFFTLVSSPSDGAEFDNQRGTLLVRAVTSDDGNSEEQSLCVLTTIQTGFTTPWAASTAYSTLGTNVNNGGNTYRLIQAGTSAGSGGPTGKTTNILDGTCRWMWINDSAINAKCGGYIETLVNPGAGSSWGIAVNTEIKPGVLANFIVSQETDLTNNCGIDSTIGGLNKYNTYLQNNGGNVSSSVLDIGSSNSTNFSSIWGLHLTGAKLASNSVIGIDASSANGIGIGTGFGGAINPTFTTAAIGDSSTAPKGVEITGAKSVAGIEVTATTPTSFASGGTKTLAGFFDVSTAPRGLLLEGTYSKSPIRMTSLPPSYADDTAAAAGGLLIGDVYRTGSALKVRVA